MIPTIIFDIDGTLANIDHRLHHVNSQPKNYDAFFSGISKDTVNTSIASLYALLEDSTDYGIGDLKLVLCSGRAEKYREATELWLNQQNIYYYNHLYMRADGDFRDDHVIKRELLAQMRNDGYTPFLAIDDRKSIVDMWRSEGITALQCSEGDFCPTKPSTANKELLHVMVGPSGAGKSTWLLTNALPSQVVSSDAIRAELGDFKDQSQNDHVFATLHEIVRARVANGLKTYVDATNIRDADRRAVALLAPSNSIVTYNVINRPMADKIRDGGWRNDVRIKGQTLIEHHEQVFKSNWASILAGDSLPNVIVRRMGS
jgi:FMN phosphatase YigB (HAD superfamily)